MIIRIAVVVISVIGHRVADGGAADPAHDRPDWTADHSPANRARDPSAYRTGFVRESRPTRNGNQGRSAKAEQKSRHGSILRLSERHLVRLYLNNGPSA